MPFSVVTTNLKTYPLKEIGFFFMRKTKPALMTSTPIANSLINYAQLLQIKTTRLTGGLIKGYKPIIPASA